MTENVDYILVSRLDEYLTNDIDPWGCRPEAFSFSYLQEADPKSLLVYDGSVPSSSLISSLPSLCGERPYYSVVGKATTPELLEDRAWHAARCLWLSEHPPELETPIVMDNHCYGGKVYPLPTIMDGWHRLFAHKLLKREKIAVSYGGRVDLLNYLSGKRKTPPSA